MNAEFKVMDGQDPNRPDTYWSIGFRTARTGFAVKYVLVSLLVFFAFVLFPLYLYAPEFFSFKDFAALSAAARKELFSKAPVAFMIVSVPFCLSVAVMVVGQIRRFHDFNKPGWLCVLNIVPFAAFGIILLLMAVPGMRGPNRYGEDPHDRRAREAAELERKRRALSGK